MFHGAILLQGSCCGSGKRCWAMILFVKRRDSLLQEAKAAYPSEAQAYSALLLAPKNKG